jgi:hypothetical protein
MVINSVEASDVAALAVAACSRYVEFVLAQGGRVRLR